MAAQIEGSWLGDGASGDALPPRLVVAVSDIALGPPAAREVMRIPLAAMPFVASDLSGPQDLCSDEPSSPATLAVQCVVDDHVIHASLEDLGDSLEVNVSGEAPRRWQMPMFEHACYALRPIGVTHDLERLRALWGRDIPSERCRTTPPVPVRVAISLPPGPSKCSNLPNSGANATHVVLSTASWSSVRDLGLLGDQCGGLHITEYDDVDAVTLGTSDMGVEQRFAYRLGDRLYFSSATGGIGSADLPCGARVSFVVPTGAIVEHTRRP